VQSKDFMSVSQCEADTGIEETLSWASKSPHFLMLHGFALKERWRSL